MKKKNYDTIYSSRQLLIGMGGFTNVDYYMDR